MVLGYDAGPVAAVAALITTLAIFQHANVRIRFPVLRWVLPSPEWHHWHHATDAEAHDTNFGVPDPVPADAYLAQLRYPFRSRAPQRHG